MIIYCYKSKPPNNIQGNVTIKFHQGLPSLEAIRNIDRKGKQDLVLVLEDLLTDFSQLTGSTENDYTDLVVEISRRENISMIIT
jgi:hypothetical protein